MCFGEAGRFGSGVQTSSTEGLQADEEATLSKRGEEGMRRDADEAPLATDR